MSKKILFILFIALVSLIQTSCSKSCEEKKPESLYAAYTMDRTSFENSVQLLPSQTNIKSGKIYIKDNFLFINDENKGFQIYDYTDALHPIPISYLKIPGATDVAIRDNTFYINQATDLVALTYNTTNNTITITKRIRNTFPQKLSPDGFSASTQENQIVISWYLKI